jgi:hypothetical protein
MPRHALQGREQEEWTMRGRMNDRKGVSALGSRGREVAALAVLMALGSVAAATGCSTGPDGETVSEETEAVTTPVTVSFRNGALPTASYTGTDDATIRQANPTTNYGAATTCEADGDDGNGVDKSCVLRWNVSSIPSGSTIQSASITVRVTDGTGNTYGFYSVLRAWTESQVTWQNAASSSPWATAGALGGSDRGAAVGTITGATGSRTVTLNATGVSLVQSWVNGGTNGGIILASTSNTDGIDLASSENGTVSDRPTLTVTYLPPDTGTGGTGGSGGTAGTGGTGATGGAVATGGTASISTDPNLKIGFIGDTDTGTNFRSVLTLIKNEGAAAVVVEGDMSYSSDPTAWWGDVNSVLGSSFPVFISRGNHDDPSWTGYLAEAANHLGGATRVAGAHDANYKTTFRGLVIATVKVGDTGARIAPFLQNDAHVWKICQWHQNQQAMQIGTKTDEMGWDVYETCRQQGAIVETGHEHSYERTKTLTNMTSQVVDTTCPGAGSLCVGPGRTFANVVGLGGNSVRSQSRCLPATAPYGCNGEWAFIYTSNQGAVRGAQFIVFNDTAPKHASGYFKNVNGVTVDTFSITHD